MDNRTVYFLGLILAQQARLEGMRAENQLLVHRGVEPIYWDQHFREVAQELERLAHEALQA